MSRGPEGFGQASFHAGWGWTVRRNKANKRSRKRVKNAFKGLFLRMGGRAVEGARLESAYTSKAYRGFESHLIRHIFSLCICFNLRNSRSAHLNPQLYPRPRVICGGTGWDIGRPGHECRRTAVTLMQKLGIVREVRDAGVGARPSL